MKLKLSSIIATIFFALFAPAASAQQTNCTLLVDSATVGAVRAFWESADVEVVSACIKAGANVNARTTGSYANMGYTPLHQAAQFNDNPAVINTLILLGAKVNVRNEAGATPLHEAASYGNPAVVTALIMSGAVGNARNMFGQMPYDLAQKNPDLKGSDAYWALSDARFK